MLIWIIYFLIKEFKFNEILNSINRRRSLYEFNSNPYIEETIQFQDH